MTNLETLTLKELRNMAKEQGVKDWWNMKKVDLIEALSTEAEEVQEVVEDEEQVVEETVAHEEIDVEVVEAEPEIVQEAPEEVKPESNVNALAVEAKPTKKNQKRMIEYNGKTQTLNAWAKELGIRHQTLYNRIVMKGWDVDKAFETPTKKEKATEELVEA